jgi:GntP family gluconate:H+ symporter
LIALASIIGQCLLESGAAAVIVDRMLRLTGPKRAPEALAASSFLLGIPVFFDTVFYLMIPLARSLRQRLGKDYVLFILAILAGGSIAHSLVPPTPGPLMVAEIVGVDVATMMMAGLIIGGCSSVVSLSVARIINRLVDVPLRFTEEETAEQSSDRRDEPPVSDSTTQGPSLLRSLNPIAIPVVLIAVGSVVNYMIKADSLQSSAVTEILQFFGDKNIAIAVGVAFAFSLTKYCPAGKRASMVGRSLASAGNIILITAAGGAFGAMLRQAGIEDAVGSLAQGVPGLMLLPLAFVVTAAIRTLQGSATVAMITAAGVLQGFAQPESLPFHPVYLAMAIGAGSKPVSWMTDSAFWVITRMSGMTEAEGLRVISPMSTAMGFSALAFTMLFATIYPGT